MQKVKDFASKALKIFLLISCFMLAFNLVALLFYSDHKIKISRQDVYTSGTKGICQVSVVKDKNGEPLDTKVRINLLDEKKKSVKKLYEGKTKDDGTVDADFEMPAVKDGQYYLSVKATANLKTDSVLEKINVIGLASVNKVTINLDKMIYKPGDQVNFRALLTSNKDDSPVQTEALVSIFDGNENKVYSKNIESSKYGIISDDFQLADQVNNGIYKIRIEYGKTVGEKYFDVKPYVLPKFKAAIETDKKEYLIGETIKGKVKAYYMFGKAIEGGKAQLKLNGNNIQSLAINEGGTALFQIPVKTEGELELTAAVIDSSNYTAEASNKVFAGREKLVVKVLPENNELVPGINNEVFIFTSKIDGTPVKTYITITGDKTKQVSTDENGVAKFTTIPKVDNDTTGDSYYTNYYNLKITDENGNFLKQEKISLTIKRPGYGLIVRPDKSIYAVNEKIDFNISSNIDNGITHLVISKNGQPLKMLNTDKDNVEVELPKDTYGLIDVYAERQGNFREYSRRYSQPSKAQCFKSIFIKPNKNMNVTINKENRFFKPGEELQLSLDIKDGNNAPLNSAIMISIADEALSALKKNDMSLDNIRLALSDIDMGETINGIDLYSAILNNAPQETLTALLLKRNAKPSEFRESNFDNIQKREITQSNFFKWLLAALLLLGVLLFVTYRWFRFALLHMIGILITIALGLFLIQPDDLDDFRFFAALIVSTIFYILIIRSFSPNKNAESKEKLYSPVPAGVALVMLLLIGVFIIRYIMPMFEKNQVLSSTAGSEIDMIAPNGAEFSAGGFDISDLKESASAGSVESRVRKNPFADLFKPNSSSEKDISNSSQSAEGTTAQPQKVDYAEIKKLRTQFLESMYFNPQVIAEAGKASIKIPLADNITTWKIQAVANSINGYIGFKGDSIKVFQDFFVDFELPKNLTVGDEVSIPVTVFNYLDKSQNVKINVHLGDWFTLLGKNERIMNIGAGTQQLVYIPIKVTRFGDYELRIDALGQALSDGVQKAVKVYPNGIRLQEVCASGNIEKKVDEKVFFTEKDIEGTRKIKIKIYTASVAQVVEGLEGILAMPSGCFEQVSSTLYPDILVLKYLKDSKQSNPEIEAKANSFIESGFQKLLTYEVKNQRGGFSLFGGSPAETVLTAYGLMEFSDLKEVYPVDENVINRMRGYIFSKQNLDGSFSTEGLHIGGASSHDKTALTAYVGWALSQSCKDDKRFKKTVDYLKKKAEDTEDLYTLALIANVLVNTDNGDAKKILNRLVNKITLDKDYAYLSSNTRDYYGSYGKVQNLQTTALASIALTNANLYNKTNKQFISYILSNKDTYGTFGTTQATILCLKALIERGKKGQPKDDTVILSVNGKQESISIKGKNALNYFEKEFTNVQKDNAVSLSAKTELTYEITKEHYLPYDQIKEGNSIAVSRSIPTECKVNDTVFEQIRVINRQQESIENLIVQVQIPQGFVVDENTLEELKINSTIEKYEAAYDKLNLYIRNVQPSEFKQLRIGYRAGYPVNITSGNIHAYDYYNPSVYVDVKPIRIKVAE